MTTYTVAADKRSITCHLCGKTSHNENDVLQLYCGHCHRFHQGVAPGVRMNALMPGSTTFQAAVMCPRCGNHFPAGMTDPAGLTTGLTPGGFTICGQCLSILQFNDQLQPHALDTADLIKLPKEQRDILGELWMLTYLALQTFHDETPDDRQPPH